MFRTKDGGQIFSNGSDQSSNDSVAPTIDDLNLDLQNRSELERRSAHAAQQVGDSDRDALEWDDRTDAGGFAPFGDSDPSVVNKIHMEYQQHGAERVDEGDLKEWSSALKELREPHDREYGPTMSDVSESALSLEDIHFGYPADLNDQRRKAERSFRDEFDDYHDDEGFDIRENTATNSEQMKGGREVEQIRMMQNEPADYPEGNGRVLESQIENQVQLSDSDSLWDEQLEQSIDSDSESGELDIFERSLPPGLPKSRIRKIRKVFEGTLGDPSMLNLIPLLRENIPEDVTLKWLRQKNLQNAYFVIEKAREDKTVDVQFLNNALQVVASSGSIGRALSFHAVEFGGYGMVRLLKVFRRGLSMTASLLTYH